MIVTCCSFGKFSMARAKRAHGSPGQVHRGPVCQFWRQVDSHAFNTSCSQSFLNTAHTRCTCRSSYQEVKRYLHGSCIRDGIHLILRYQLPKHGPSSEGNIRHLFWSRRVEKAPDFSEFEIESLTIRFIFDDLLTRCDILSRHCSGMLLCFW